MLSFYRPQILNAMGFFFFSEQTVHRLGSIPLDFLCSYANVDSIEIESPIIGWTFGRLLTIFCAILLCLDLLLCENYSLDVQQI